MQNSPPYFKLHEFIAHSTEVRCITVGLFQSLCATGGADCKINIWDVNSGNNLRVLGSNKSAVEALCFSPSEQCIVSGSASGSIKVFDLTEGRYRNLGAHKTGVTSVQYHPFSDFVASGSVDTCVKVWDVRNKECVSTYSGHEQAVTCVRFSPEGDWVASAGKDGLVLIFDMVAGKHLQTLRLSPAYVHTFEFHPFERVLGAATSLRSVKMWDLDTMELLCSSPPEPSVIRSMGFCTGSYAGYAETPYLCTATKDHVKLWSWESAGAGASMEQRGQLPLSAEGVGAPMSTMNIDSATGTITGASFLSNFASIYQTNVDELVVRQLDIQVATEERARQLQGVGAGACGKQLVQPPWGGAGEQVKATAPVREAGAGTGAANRRAETKPSSPHKGPAPTTSASASNSAQGKAGEGKGAVRTRGHRGGGEKDVYDVYNPSYEDLSGDKQRDRNSDVKPPSVASSAARSGRSNEPYDPFADAEIIAAATAVAEPKPRGTAAAAAAGLFSPLIDKGREGKDVSPGSPSPTFTPPKEREREKEKERQRGGIGSNGVSPVAMPLADEQSSRAGAGAGTGTGTGTGTDRIAMALERKEAVHALSTRLPPTRLRPPTSGGISDAAIPIPISVPASTDDSKNQPSSSSSSSLSILSEAVRGSRDFSSILSQRLVAIRTLRKMWEKGDLEAVLDYLCTVQESAKHDSLQLVVLADFFGSVKLRGNGLCLDSCTRLLPLLDAILATSTHSRTLHGSGTLAPASEHITQAVVKALLTLTSTFGERIRGTCVAAKQAGPYGNVDVNRDERLGKCKVCYQSITHVRQRLSNMTLQHKGNAGLHADIGSFLDLVESY